MATAAVILSVLFLLKQCNSGTPGPEKEEVSQEKTAQDSGRKEESEEHIPEVSVSDTVKAGKSEEKQEKPEIATTAVHMKSKNYYQAPLDGPLYLSGTFGELRGNHFHAGLDIRTGGREGASIKAAASGYVSRIKVSTAGYGKALYIQHPNGTTTVYGHLQKFSGAIQKAVIQRQYQKKTYEFDWYVPAGHLKVTKGQVVAVSGNSGGSGGPHLHFEIRDARGNTVNPLLYDIRVSDKINPVISSCRIYHLDRGRYERYGTYASLKIPGKGKTIEVAPGTYGVGANWVDYFSDRLNRLGINYAELRVDGKRIFTQTIEDFAFNQGRYINKHIDYWQYAESGIRYVKLFKDYGNPLHFYKGKGEFNITNGETLKIEVMVRDFSGHETNYGFTVKGKVGASPLNQGGQVISGGKLCTPSVGCSLQSSHGSLSIPGGSLYNRTYVSITESDPTGKAVSPMIRVNHHNIPLHKSATIQIKIPEEVKGNSGQLVMMRYDRKARNSSYEGGKRSGNYIVETTKNLGMFYLAIDSTSPRITPLKLDRYLSFRVDDATSGIGQYTCTIDGEWMLLEHEPKSRKLYGDVPAKYGSGKHELVLVVYDHVGNKTELKKTLKL